MKSKSTPCLSQGFIHPTCEQQTQKNKGRREYKVKLNLLECAKRSQDGAANPDAVFPLGWCHHLDLHATRGQRRNLLAHSISDTGEHGGTTAKYYVSIQVLPNIDITFHDRVVCGLVDSCCFHSNHRRLEKHLGASETLSTYGDHLPIRELVAFLYGRASPRSLQLLLIVEGYVSELFFHVSHNFPLSCGGERVATLREDFHQMIGQVPASQIKTKDGMGKGITLVDGDSVTDTITRIQNNT
nr:Fumarate reductase [Ipomoea batatas]GMD02016.1 Fumarate reductase [Ipomoea batatas]